MNQHMESMLLPDAKYNPRPFSAEELESIRTKWKGVIDISRSMNILKCQVCGVPEAANEKVVSPNYTDLVSIAKVLVLAEEVWRLSLGLLLQFGMPETRLALAQGEMLTD
jgi:hypothetical protein